MCACFIFIFFNFCFFAYFNKAGWDLIQSSSSCYYLRIFLSSWTLSFYLVKQMWVKKLECVCVFIFACFLVIFFFFLAWLQQSCLWVSDLSTLQFKSKSLTVLVSFFSFSLLFLFSVFLFECESQDLTMASFLWLTLLFSKNGNAAHIFFPFWAAFAGTETTRPAALSRRSPP